MFIQSFINISEVLATFAPTSTLKKVEVIDNAGRI